MGTKPGRVTFADRTAEARRLKEIGSQLSPKIESTLSTTQAAGKAWEAVKTGSMNGLTPREKDFTALLQELRKSAPAVTEASLESMVGSSQRLGSAFTSYTAMVDLLGQTAVGGAVGSGLPANVLGAQRAVLSGRVGLVLDALKAAGNMPELRSMPVAELEKLKQAIDVESAAIKPSLSEQSLRPADVAQTADAARAVSKALQNDAFSASRIETIASKLAPDAKAAFEKTWSSVALLVDQALNAPDYRQTGMGYHNPKSRYEYSNRFWEPRSASASEGRVEDTYHALSSDLDAALKSPRPDLALEKVLVDSFVRETGARVKKEWKVTPEAVRKALDANLLLPLRALNETIDEMAPRAAYARPMLKDAIDQVTQHVLEGDYQQWRYQNPASKQQLAALTPRQNAAWQQATTTESLTADGVKLKVREEDGLGLLWLTKIGGPSHGFDVGGHCLLPALVNGRTQPIVVEDPRWPHGPAARAYVRLLNVEGSGPQVYLEPLQIDFPHREAFPASGANFQRALIAHAYQKAKAMGVPLSLDPELASMAEQMGLAGKQIAHRYVLEPSGGVFEASDTLSRKHDWVQTEREVTDSLWRYVIDTGAVAP